MTDHDDHELLAAYACLESEAAFAMLVSRYVPLVYSAALRFTGNSHEAEEITQAVFIILARKAGSLRRGTVLSGWLYQTARLTAANFVRGEIHRRQREQEAYLQSTSHEPTAVWQQIAPLLDEAMGRLNEADRNAVVLRFFENKSAAEAAAVLNLNESATRKRVARALEKLRKFFAKRGVDPVRNGHRRRGLRQFRSGRTDWSDPYHFHHRARQRRGGQGGSTYTLAKGTLKLMAWTKAKTGIVAGVCVLIAAGTTTVLVEKQLAARQYTIAQAPWAEAGAATPKAALQSLAWAFDPRKLTAPRVA